MSRNTEYEFLNVDTATLEAEMVARYEELCGVTVQPASPERLFIAWVADVVRQVSVLGNYIGNQNIPSRAEGENLDALAELFYLTERPAATAATCTMEFTISEAQNTSILIPAGTRVTDQSVTLYWETVEDAYVAIGETTTTVKASCQTAGVAGNGYAVGQVNTCVDIFDYYASCQNITETDGGSDAATDEEFYELLRASNDAYSTAGSVGAYIYHAKSVSTEIGDVVANSPTPGYVDLYILMEDGAIATEEVKAAVAEACSADEVRPLTDYVSVKDPETVPYNIDLTYYIKRNATTSTADTIAAVEEAVETYQAWQSGALGRDINPSTLYAELMGAGIKRLEVREPAFASLNDGGDGSTPQVAQIGTVTLVNGGYEDE